MTEARKERATYREQPIRYIHAYVDGVPEPGKVHDITPSGPYVGHEI